MARTMLDEYKTQDVFWAEAVNTACHSLNRLYLHKLLKKTTYELLIGKKPNVLYFRVFGCKWFILSKMPRSSKFASKVDEGFLLGYEANSRAYRVFNKTTGIVEVSRDVTFDETNGSQVEQVEVNDARIGISWENIDNTAVGDVRPREVEREQEASPDGGEWCCRSGPPTRRGPTPNPRSWHICNLHGAMEVRNCNACMDIKKEVSVLRALKFIFVPALKIVKTGPVCERVKVEDVLEDPDCEMAMQEELNNFKRNESAFLNGPISELVYVEQPPGFKDPKHSYHIYKLHKALYRVKQASRAWYECLRDFLAENGFKIGKADTTIFIKKVKNGLFVCQIYVDGIIFGSTNISFSEEYNRIMTKRFEMSMMGELKFLLGLQVKQLKDNTFISQTKYFKDVLKKFDMDGAKPIKTPMPINGHLNLNINGKDVDVKYPPSRRIGKKKVDEVSPSRRRGKGTANRGRPSSGRIEEPSSSPPTRPAYCPCDAQHPNHEAAEGAISLVPRKVQIFTPAYETPRRRVEYLRNMTKAKTDRGKALEAQLECNLDYRFYTDVQVDWYNSIIMGRKKPAITEMKWID
uniref:Uncharacterized protein n=1 Tax=Oryza brachyantha TaxID=4533 RepID=J3N803_ORYBR